MPALKNPRHEAFAQAIFKGLAKHGDKPIGNGHAYLEAGYRTTLEGARRSASRLLTFVDGISERVAELQRQANERLEDKLDISRETIGKRLRTASRMAERQENPANMVAAELGMLRAFHPTLEANTDRIDFNSAQSMQDIGRKLFQSVGFREPDDASIAEAVTANDVLIDTLLAIHKRAQGQLALP